MADAVIGTAVEASVLVPSLWSQRWYDALLADLPFNSVVSKDWEGEIQSLGDTVKISQIPEFDQAQELPEGSRNDADAVTATQQSLTINTRLVKDFIVTNKAQMQSIPFVDKLRELAVYSINKAIQAKIISLIVPSASAPDHTIAFDTGTTLALADLLEGKELLDNQNVPMTDRHLVVGAAQMNDVFNITGFTSSDFLTSGQPLATGQLPPSLVGFAPHFTSVAGNVSYLFQNMFFTIAAQKNLNIDEFNLGVDGKRATRVNVDVLMGFKQLDSKRVVTLS